MLLSDLERRFINGYQGGFPLVDRPFEKAAGTLDIDEDRLITMVSGLLDRGLLTRFGPLYDAARLGGGLSLAALSVPDKDFDGVSYTVNAFPQVAHNYRRDHELNMWFVIATDRSDEVESTIEAIARSTGLEVLNLPKLKEFYIGLWLEIDPQGRVDTVPLPGDRPSSWSNLSLEPVDRRIIKATQAGLPINRTPYRSVARETGLDQDEVLGRMQALLAGGVIRRIGAVPNHYRLGLTDNGMSVWDIPDHAAPELGELVGQLDYVSHCYLRPRHLPQWPYNLFAMVHGPSRDEVDERINQVAGMLGADCRGHDTLYSTAILKKTGLRLVA